MCGIAATFPAYANRDRFNSALQTLHHRGPDAEGIHHDVDGLFSFGHKRLKIIDVEDRSNQPFKYEYVILIFNGEIYNYLELRLELQKAGYKFHTQGDTEVVAAAYLRWGEVCLSKFVGMWSVVLWDFKANRAFIARDRFGEKPLLYSIDNGQLFFASELKAIMRLRRESFPSLEIDEISRHPLRPMSRGITPIKDVFMFPHGCYAFIYPKANKLQPLRYWDTSKELVQVPGRYEDQVVELRALIKDAVKLRMRSDVAVATSLSGGIDSSCIYAQVQSLKDSVATGRAFCARFRGSIFDESVDAKDVVDHFHEELELIDINPESGIDRLIGHQYLFENIYLTPPTPMMQLYSAIKQNGITVTLDGHGADEMFSGYGGHLEPGIFRAFPNLGVVEDIFMAHDRFLDGCLRGERIGHLKALNRFFHVGRSMNMNLSGILKHTVSEHLKGGVNSGIKGALYSLFHETTLPTLLRNYDLYSMSASVESRMPFMDHRLVSFVFSLPDKSLVRHGYPKAPLRSAFKDELPQRILYGKGKIGFNSPMNEWIESSAWRSFIQDEIHSSAFKSCPLVSYDKDFGFLSKAMNALSQGRSEPRSGDEVWARIKTYLWHQYFFKPASQ